MNMKKNRGHARCNAAGLKFLTKKENELDKILNSKKLPLNITFKELYKITKIKINIYCCKYCRNYRLRYNFT